MNKRFRLVYFVALLTAGIIVACSGESAETAATEDIVIEPGEDTTAREPGFFERTRNHPFDNRTLNAYKLAKKGRKFVTYFVNTYRGTFFLQQNRSEKFDSKGQPVKNLLFGLIDSKGQQLLPVEYERIGNPGFILDDYMEVRKGGKYGLFNYAENKLIAPEYDVLYPSSIMEYIAIGQKGDRLYKIYGNGQEKEMPADAPAPSYSRILKQYPLNTDSEWFGMWVSTDAFNQFGEEYFQESSYYMYQTPSYLSRLGVFPELIDYIKPGWHEFGKDSMNLVSEGARQRNEHISSLITRWYSYAAEARGSETERYYLTTMDKKNGRKGGKELLFFDYYDIMYSNDAQAVSPKIRFINDSIVEIRSFIFNENTSLPYQHMTCFRYCSIGSNGSITSIDNGLFTAVSTVEMTRDHFKGCFARPLDESATIASDIYDEDMEGLPVMVYSDHLSLADLEYMRNELYARKGMIFTDPSWDAEFRSKKWYKPKYKKIDKYLTPIEKKNIQLIRTVEKELKERPEKLIHEQQKYFVVAG